jgi:hypothetical protein
MFAHWPQITLLALMVLNAGVSLANHGRSRDCENFWTHMISVASCLWILDAGGFFNVLK